VPILLPETGAKVENQSANNTRIHGSRNWTWKNQGIPKQI